MKKYVSSHLKDMNRLTVYELFAKNDEISRSELAQRSGISAPTVLKIVSFMLEQNLLLELGEGEASIGRKPQMLTLNPDALYTIGVIMEGKYIRAGIMDLTGNILCLISSPASSDLRKDAQQLLPSLFECLTQTSGVPMEKVKGIGIGIHGVYDRKNTTIVMSPLMGIHEAENIDWLIRWLEDTYQVQVAVDNDVNMCAVGEYHARNQAESDLIYIGAGTGVGAGIILNGKLRAGQNYRCGEIGYMQLIDKATPQEKTGEGWLEARTNISALYTRFASDGDGLSQNSIPDAIEYAADYLSLCINNLETVLDCRCVVVGGAIVDMLGEGLIHAINSKLQTYAWTDLRVSATLCKDAGVEGACCEIRKKLIQTMLMQ